MPSQHKGRDNGEITSKPARVKRAADSSPIMKAESAADSCNQRYNQMASRFVYHFNIIMQTLMNRTYDLQLIYSFSQEREKCIYHKLFEVGGKRFTIRLPFFIFDTSHFRFDWKRGLVSFKRESAMDCSVWSKKELQIHPIKI